ncbi:hypothetical protein DDI_2221 [Dickeya dianthicola RNS04.9]|nr:hypothetical protein DDI_2221 [Dickeya dianthicola RNS04.9]
MHRHHFIKQFSCQFLSSGSKTAGWRRGETALCNMHSAYPVFNVMTGFLAWRPVLNPPYCGAFR